MDPRLSEDNQSLLRLVAPPLLWAAHLLLSYCTAAIYCEKVAPDGGSLGAARVAIAAYTVVALAALVGLSVAAYRRHTYGDAALPHDFDSPEDRHRFLGFATLLLAGISIVAVLYQALPAIIMGTCV
jgi:hypothetical protein